MKIAGGFVGEEQLGLGHERAAAMPTSCCWPPESCAGIKILLARCENDRAVAHDALRSFLGVVAIGERDLEVFVNGEIVEEVVALEDEPSCFFCSSKRFFLSSFARLRRRA